MSTNATVDRRRVLQGAAWATPAVLVATALPAAAASPPRVGGLTLTSYSAYQDTSTLTVSTYVSYVGDGAPSPDYAVSAVSVTITVPTVNVAAGAGTTTSSGWSYTSRSVSGSNTVFVFTWTGANLSGTNTITSQLVAVLPKATTRTAFTITMRASGTSNAAAVNSSTQSITVGAYALITLPSGLTATRDAYTGNARYMHFVAPVLNSSATNAAGANVVGLTAVITVPTAATAAGNGTVEAGNWSFTSRATSGSNTLFTFTYTGGAIAPSATNTAASFRLPMVSAIYLTTPTVSVAFQGKSPTASGAATSVSGSDTLDLNL